MLDFQRISGKRVVRNLLRFCKLFKVRQNVIEEPEETIFGNG